MLDEKAVKGAGQVLSAVCRRRVAEVVHAVGGRIVAPPVVEAARVACGAKFSKAVLGNDIVAVLATAFPLPPAVAIRCGGRRHLHRGIEVVKAVCDGAARDAPVRLRVRVEGSEMPLSWRRRCVAIGKLGGHRCSHVAHR